MCADDATEMLKKQEFIDLCRRNGIALAMLFGSASKGTATPMSDLDLAVSLRPGSLPVMGPLRSRARRQIIRDLGVYLARTDLDAVVLDEADPLLKFEIALGGKPIYEECPGLFADFCSLAVRQHEDAKVFYRATDAYLHRASREGGTET